MWCDVFSPIKLIGALYKILQNLWLIQCSMLGKLQESSFHNNFWKISRRFILLGFHNFLFPPVEPLS